MKGVGGRSRLRLISLWGRVGSGSLGLNGLGALLGLGGFVYFRDYDVDGFARSFHVIVRAAFAGA